MWVQKLFQRSVVFGYMYWYSDRQSSHGKWLHRSVNDIIRHLGSGPFPQASWHKPFPTEPIRERRYRSSHHIPDTIPPCPIRSAPIDTPFSPVVYPPPRSVEHCGQRTDPIRASHLPGLALDQARGTQMSSGPWTVDMPCPIPRWNRGLVSGVPASSPASCDEFSHDRIGPR